MTNALHLEKLAKLTFLVITSIGLISCSTAYLPRAFTGLSAYDFFQDPNVNLRVKNEAAADYLIDRAGNFMNKHHQVQAKALSNTLDPALTSDFMNIVAHHAGGRLLALGYNIDLSNVSHATYGDAYTPSKTMQSPRLILSGYYTLKKFDPAQLQFDKSTVDISLQITNAKTGQIVSEFTYTVPVSREIGMLLETKPTITQIRS